MELLDQVLETEGLWILIAAVTTAGVVRGFAGFGAGLVFIPIAGTVLPPVAVLVAVTMFDMFGAFALIPRAFREGQKPEVLKLVIGLALGLPVGLWILTRMDPDVFRYAVCILSFVLFLALVSGWRYRGKPSSLMIGVVGWFGGFMGGSTGMAGPPVILFYLGGKQAAAAIRANIILFFLASDFLFLLLIHWNGLLTTKDAALGLLLAVPFAAATVIGQKLFDPEREKLFRAVAYVIIVASAILGLPILDSLAH